MKLASVIILNWNGLQHIEECLNSVINQTYENYEIIFVDNASTDASVEFVKTKFPSIKIIVNDKNYGFAKGVNIGIKHAKGEYILLLNNDAIADKNWISELIKAAELNDKIGMVASKILLYTERDKINCTGTSIHTNGAAMLRDYYKKDTQSTEIEEVFGPNGAACLFKRELFKNVGYYDEDYFMYSEETDLAWRARIAGWKCVYNPRAIAYHKFSVERSLREFSVRYNLRNTIWTFFKNFSLYYQIRFLPKHIFYLVFFVVLYFISRKSIVPLKAVFEGLKGLPKIVNKHHEVQRLRKVDDITLVKWFKPYPYTSQ